MNKYNFQVGDDLLYKGQPTYVTGATNTAIFVKDGRSEKMIIKKTQDNIAPIPITEEWLKLNNFNLDAFLQATEYEYEYKLWVSDDNRLQIANLSNTIDGGYHAHLDNEDLESIGSLDVQYVHQLLHLCRDCNYKFKPKFK